MAADPKLIEMTELVVSSYVAGNKLNASDLPDLIKSVHAALANIGQPVASADEAPAKLTAAQIRKSITPSAIISFVDQKPYRTMKRHLTTNGMTPADYRERFGLPADYPMVAPDYSAQRSALALKLGLGRKAVAKPSLKKSARKAK